MSLGGWTRANLRHFGLLLRRGAAPAARVYDSIGESFFLALAPGWLNLGLWNGPGDEREAAVAPAQLVRALAEHLPRGGVIVDVGNGLGAQDPVIAEVVQPATLVAVNVTESQLRAGADALRRAAARPVVADAVRLPLGDGVADGLICVEAAFHFSSRAAFFAEARRVLRPGGVLAISDIAVQRRPRDPLEWFAGATSVRFWGLRRSALCSAREIGDLLAAAGFTQVQARLVGDRVFDPVLAVLRRRLRDRSTVLAAPAGQVAAARLMLAQWRLLRRRGLLDYLLLVGRVHGET